MKNYKFIIHGKVQGVYYRVSVQKNALTAGYSGYVKNLRDGSVEAGLTCKESQLENFINLLKKGSTCSSVISLKYQETNERFHGNFEIL